MPSWPVLKSLLPLTVGTYLTHRCQAFYNSVTVLPEAKRTLREWDEQVYVIFPSFLEVTHSCPYSYYLVYSMVESHTFPHGRHAASRSLPTRSLLAKLNYHQSILLVLPWCWLVRHRRCRGSAFSNLGVPLRNAERVIHRVVAGCRRTKMQTTYNWGKKSPKNFIPWSGRAHSDKFIHE